MNCVVTRALIGGVDESGRGGAFGAGGGGAATDCVCGGASAGDGAAGGGDTAVDCGAGISRCGQCLLNRRGSLCRASNARICRAHPTTNDSAMRLTIDSRLSANVRALSGAWAWAAAQAVICAQVEVPTPPMRSSARGAKPIPGWRATSSRYFASLALSAATVAAPGGCEPVPTIVTSRAMPARWAGWSSTQTSAGRPRWELNTGPPEQEARQPQVFTQSRTAYATSLCRRCVSPCEIAQASACSPYWSTAARGPDAEPLSSRESAAAPQRVQLRGSTAPVPGRQTGRPKRRRRGRMVSEEGIRTTCSWCG